MRGGTRWTAAAGAALVLAAGCAQREPAAAPGPRPAVTAAPAVAPPVTVTLTQSRAFAARRMLQVRLRWPARLSPGSLDGRVVLVAGGAGAVGHAAVQLARWAGATVLATTSPTKTQYAEAAGAHHVVYYRDEDAAAQLRGFAPDGVDLVVEVAAGANNELDLAVLRTRGTSAIYANDGDQPVRIERFDLRTGRFAPAGPVARDTEIAPGRRLFVPLPYGEARCDAPAEGPVLAVRARVGDGPPGDADLALPAPDPLLERLHGRECAQAALREQFDIAFAPEWTADGDVLRGTLVVARRGTGGEAVTVAGISGNVLYTLRAVPPPPAVLAPDAARLELPVEITLARCEAHALIEAKLRHRFPLWAGAGDRPADPLTVEAEGEGRRQLDDLLARCLAEG